MPGLGPGFLRKDSRTGEFCWVASVFDLTRAMIEAVPVSWLKSYTGNSNSVATLCVWFGDGEVVELAVGFWFGDEVCFGVVIVFVLLFCVILLAVGLRVDESCVGLGELVVVVVVVVVVVLVVVFVGVFFFVCCGWVDFGDVVEFVFCACFGGDFAFEPVDAALLRFLPFFAT